MSKFINLIKDKLSMSGIENSKEPLTYIMLLTSIILMITSLVVPYYSDSNGNTQIYESNRECLGFIGKDCVTMHALPIVTIIIGFIVLMFLTTGALLPKFIMNNSFVKGMSSMKTMLLNIFEFFHISIPILIILLAILSIANLATQLGTPISSGQSLTDQAKDSNNPVTFKEGMALSVTSTVLIIFIIILNIKDLTKFKYFDWSRME